MSISALKAAATGTAVATRSAKPQSVMSLLTDPSFQEQMKLAVPRHMTAERLARIALTEVRRVQKLGQCDPASFAGAIMTCAQLGLEPGSGLGHAYLLPFDNRRAGRVECQLIIGYRGMIDLARRSGQIISIEARAVFEADHFRVAFGLGPDLEHVPAWEKDDRGPIRFVYAVAKLKGGGVQFEVMSRSEIEKVRAKSKAGTSGPWVDHWEEMAKKTVIRRLFKYLPVSIEMQRAVIVDERSDAGLVTLPNDVIDGGIDSLPAPAEDAPVADPPALDFVLKAIASAPDVETLDIAGDFIGEIADTEERAQALDAYGKRKAALEAQA